MQGDRAEDPGDAERHGADQHRTAGDVGAVHRPAADDLAPRAERHPLEGDGRDRSSDQGGDRGEKRRVGRLRPALEDQRAEAAAEDRPERETGHREGAHDESLPRAPQGERDRESDYAPVQDGHGQRA